MSRYTPNKDIQKWADALALAFSAATAFACAAKFGLPLWVACLCTTPSAYLLSRMSSKERVPLWQAVGLVALMSVYLWYIELPETQQPVRGGWRFVAFLVVCWLYSLICNRVGRRHRVRPE